MGNSVASRGTALISGASSAIGAVYADRLAKRGYDLILVARSRERLEEMAANIQKSTGRSVVPLIADLREKEGLWSVETVLRDDQSITMVVNNAGIGSAASVLDDWVDYTERMSGLNALTRRTCAIAPVFAIKGHGTIVNVSSVDGVAAEMLEGVYSASKSYVLRLGQSLQNELSGTGVRVQTVLPSKPLASFWDCIAVPKQAQMTADDLVDAALEGLDIGELVTIPRLRLEVATAS